MFANLSIITVKIFEQCLCAALQFLFEISLFSVFARFHKILVQNGATKHIILTYSQMLVDNKMLI